MSLLADRVQTLGTENAFTLGDNIAECESMGIKVIRFNLGEPDFDTPEHIAQAGIAAIQAGHTRYTSVAGIAPLRAAIVEKFQRENNLTFSPEQITVGCGAKQLLFSALMATLDEGDEVVFPTPCWVSYPEMVKLNGGVPVAIPTTVDSGFILQPQDLRAALNDNSKWIMLNSPSNPTGAVYSAADLQALAEVLRDFPRVLILSDDIYEHLVYGDVEFATMAAVAPDLAARTLTVNGVSKSYAMTGWRVGYAGGPLELIKAMNTVQGQSTSHTSSISQYASVTALTGDQSFMNDFRAAFKARRDAMVKRINDVPGLSCDTPDGAFYVFADCRELLGNVTPGGKLLVTDMDFAMYLMEEAGVAVVPGSGFLADGFIRISYAASDEQLASACAAIHAAVIQLVDANASATS